MKGWKTAATVGWVAVLTAALFVGWVFLSRHEYTQRVQKEQAVQEAAALRDTVRQAGGESLKIVTFYASPARVAVGQPTLLCYGVANADQVRIEPAGPAITPSLSRCIEVKPAKSMVYRLVAQSGRDRKVEAEA